MSASAVTMAPLAQTRNSGAGHGQRCIRLPLPDLERARRCHAAFTRIEAEHHFAETYGVESTFGSGLRSSWRSAVRSALYLVPRFMHGPAVASPSLALQPCHLTTTAEQSQSSTRASPMTLGLRGTYKEDLIATSEML